MTRALALLLAAFALLLPGGGALAQTAWSGARVVSTTSWVEEWDPVARQWVRIEDAGASAALPGAEAAIFERASVQVSHTGNITWTETVIERPVRFLAATPRASAQHAASTGAQFGPFRVLDDRRAALVGSTDAASPQAFAAMLAAHPGLEVIEFVDAPGTSHDLANLRLGRAIRAAGLATHVPAGGSARSGAVELFLAGTRRTMEPGALFAVHSWRDERGREPADFATDAPENRLYLDYYAEMGMSDEEARAFYAMTNSVPHAGARWLEMAEMARWIPSQGQAPRAPATRALDPLLENDLRSALALSGGVLVEALRAPWRLPPALAAIPPAPRLALSYEGAGLLDSWTAFP